MGKGKSLHGEILLYKKNSPFFLQTALFVFYAFSFSINYFKSSYKLLLKNLFKNIKNFKIYLEKIKKF